MANEKPVSKPLQLKWQSGSQYTDGIVKSDPTSVVPKFAVIGIGKSGSNIIAELNKIGMTSVSTIVIDNDSTHLEKSQADNRMFITIEADSEGTLHRSSAKAAIKESLKQIEDTLRLLDVVLVTARLCDETEAAIIPVIAEIVKEKSKAITIGIVTKPLQDKRNCTDSLACVLEELRRELDTVVLINNDSLIKSTSSQLSIDATSEVADEVVARIIRSIIEAISTPALVSPNFTDFSAIIKRGGFAAVGVGESDIHAPNRIREALAEALETPPIRAAYESADGAIVCIAGDAEMTFDEISRVKAMFSDFMKSDSQMVWGIRATGGLDGKIRVVLLLTGVDLQPAARGLGSIAPELFNIETCVQPEYSLPADLGLYQMENSEG